MGDVTISWKFVSCLTSLFPGTMLSSAGGFCQRCLMIARLISASTRPLFLAFVEMVVSRNVVCLNIDMEKIYILSYVLASRDDIVGVASCVVYRSLGVSLSFLDCGNRFSVFFTFMRLDSQCLDTESASSIFMSPEQPSMLFDRFCVPSRRDRVIPQGLCPLYLATGIVLMF